MPGTEDVEKPVYRKEPVYATKYYYEIDKWTVVDTAKSSGNDQNPSWPEPKLKDGQRTGAEEEHYFVTATYEKKKGKTETGRYEMDFSQWKELFSCYKVARIIAFVQCLQADIAPFIIHAENKEEYEGRLDSPARLEQLFRVEQRRFYRETEPMVVDQV